MDTLVVLDNCLSPILLALDLSEAGCCRCGVDLRRKRLRFIAVCQKHNMSGDRVSCVLPEQRFVSTFVPSSGLLFGVVPSRRDLKEKFWTS